MKRFGEYETFKPDEYDRLGFILYNKALHHLFKQNEGIIIKIDDNIFIVGKWIEDGKNVVGIIIEPTIKEDNLPDGTLVWLD